MVWGLVSLQYNPYHIRNPNRTEQFSQNWFVIKKLLHYVIHYTCTYTHNENFTYLLTYSLNGAGIFFEELIVTQLIKQLPAFFMETECSLPCSKSPPPDSNLSQPNPVRPIETYLPKVHFNVIFPPTPRSSQLSLSFEPPNLNPVNTSPLPRSITLFQILFDVLNI
jgi:hypothetical protein